MYFIMVNYSGFGWFGVGLVFLQSSIQTKKLLFEMAKLFFILSNFLECAILYLINYYSRLEQSIGSQQPKI